MELELVKRAKDIRKVLNEAIVAGYCGLDDSHQYETSWRFAMLLGMERVFTILLKRSYEELIALSCMSNDELVASVLAMVIEQLGE